MNIPKCRSKPPGSSIISRMMRAICMASPTPRFCKSLASFGNAKYFSRVVRYKSARSMKYLPFFENTSVPRTASPTFSRSVSLSSPPARSAASSRAGKVAVDLSRLRSARGSTSDATISFVDGACRSRVRWSTSRGGGERVPRGGGAAVGEGRRHRHKLLGPGSTTGHAKARREVV